MQVGRGCSGPEPLLGVELDEPFCLDEAEPRCQTHRRIVGRLGAQHDGLLGQDMFNPPEDGGHHLSGVAVSPEHGEEQVTDLDLGGPASADDRDGRGRGDQR